MTNRKIKYKKSLCAFLDVLGFQELVNARRVESAEKLEIYFKVIEEAAKELKDIDSKKDIGILSISDSIILSLELSQDSNENLEKFRQFCLAINLISEKLCLHDIWLRGGISLGDVCFTPEEHFIVGPGYIKAYKLEQVAIYPRVIIDPEIINFFKMSTADELIGNINKRHKGGISYDNWEGDILFDWSNLEGVFVNLRQDCPLFLDFASSFLSNKNKAQVVIESIAENLKGNIAHYGKHKWLADYMMAKGAVRLSKATGDSIEYWNDLLYLLSKL